MEPMLKQSLLKEDNIQKIFGNLKVTYEGNKVEKLPFYLGHPRPPETPLAHLPLLS